MFAASAFGVTPASRRWSRSSVLNQFRLNFLFFAGLLLASASAAMIYTRIFGEGHLGASIVHGLFIGGVCIAIQSRPVISLLSPRRPSVLSSVFIILPLTASSPTSTGGGSRERVTFAMIGFFHHMTP